MYTEQPLTYIQVVETPLTIFETALPDEAEPTSFRDSTWAADEFQTLEEYEELESYYPEPALPANRVVLANPDYSLHAFSQRDSHFTPSYGTVLERFTMQQRMMLVITVVPLLIFLLTLFTWPRFLGSGQVATAINSGLETAAPVNNLAPPVRQGETAVMSTQSISPIFSPEVRFWEPQILAWAADHDLDPDIVATIMQIESCGYPQAISSAGAQGLFQVMPFHFTAGENMLDPDTNARRGLNYYVEGLRYHNGNKLLSFAGYNGGHGTAAKGWDAWANETQRYYVWAKGIYEDAQAGLSTSPTLEQWLQAGGASLCRQAANVQNSAY